MYIFEGKCPHCHSDRGFKAFGVSGLRMFDFNNSDFSPALLDKWRNKYGTDNLGWYSLGGTCLKCKMPIVAYVLAGTKERKKIFESIMRSDLDQTPEDIPIEKIEIFPKPEAVYADESVPLPIRERFIGVQHMLRTEGMYAPDILTNCRNTLEQAVNDIGTMSGEDNLAKKLKKLLELNIISKVIYDWSTTIKDFGNDGAHYAEGTMEDARAMADFTKIFLMYVYEFPARIKERQEKLGKTRGERK